MMIDSTGDSAARKGWFISYAAIVFAMMTMQMSSLGFSPLIPEMKSAWNMNYTQVGTFTGVYGLMALIMSVPAGLLIKRFGEKKVLSVGLTLAAVGLFAVSLASDYIEGLSSRAFWIFGYRMAFISVMTGIALTAPSDWRGKAMGILGAMTALATVIGAPFVTTIGAEFGWRNGMRAFAGMALLGVVVFAVFYKQGPVELAQARTAGDAKPPGFFSAFKIPIVWVIPLLGLTNAAGFAATFFVPSVVTSHFKLDTATASLIISIAYGVGIVVNPVCGWLTDRYNRWHVMAGIVALMIPACIAMNSDSIVVFAIATTVLVSLGHATANQVYPTVAELLKGRDVGPIMGIVALGGGLFGYLGPQALGSMRQASGGFSLGWTVLTCSTTATLLLILFLKRYADRNNQRLAAQVE